MAGVRGGGHRAERDLPVGTFIGGIQEHEYQHHEHRTPHELELHSEILFPLLGGARAVIFVLFDCGKNRSPAFYFYQLVASLYCIQLPSEINIRML